MAGWEDNRSVLNVLIVPGKKIVDLRRDLKNSTWIEFCFCLSNNLLWLHVMKIKISFRTMMVSFSNIVLCSLFLYTFTLMTVVVASIRLLTCPKMTHRARQLESSSNSNILPRPLNRSELWLLKQFAQWSLEESPWLKL